MLPPSARRRPAAVAVAGLLGILLVLAGCSDEEERAAPEPEPTPIDRLNTTAMQIPRIQFCPRIDPGAIADALGDEPDDDRSWGNGDEAPVLAGGRSDVVQELGCETVVIKKGEHGCVLFHKDDHFAAPAYPRS